MKRIRAGAAALASVLLVGPAPVTLADEAPPTRVDAVTADVAGGTISVTGGATFVDVPRTVATDPAGDATVAGLGVDLTAGTISRPDPASSELVFTMEVADEIPGLFGVPETMHYGWYFVRRGGGFPGVFLLQALRTAQSQNPGADPFFWLYRFTAGGCCVPVMELEGTMQDGVITWTLPLESIGATGGHKIEAHPQRRIQVQIGVSSYTWLNVLQPDQMAVTEDYWIPRASVELGIAPAGTPVDQVPLSADAAADPASGKFTGEIPLPAEPGEYVVAARACYGSGNCGVASTTVSV